MIGPAPTSQHANGTQILCTVPKSFSFIGGFPPGISSTHAPPVVQSRSIQLSIRLALYETAVQLSKLPSSNASAGTSVIPFGRSLVRPTTKCCWQASTGGTLSITVILKEQELEL